MLSSLTTKKNIRTFSVTPENLTGENGKGGMAKVGEGSWQWAPVVEFNPGSRPARDYLALAEEVLHG